MQRTLVEELVRIPSISGNEQNVAQFLRGFLEKKGFNARIDDVGNVVAVTGTGKKTVILSGHIDTVPGDVPIELEDGKFFGRGSVDAKGSMATLAEAASAFVGSTNLRIVVVGTVEEELEGKGAHYFAEHTEEKPDFIIIGEPSSWAKVTLGYKGSIYIEYYLKKSVAHTAHPIPSAVEDALVFSNALRRYAKEFNVGKEKAFELLSYSLRAINTVSDGLFEEATMLINFRTPLGFNFSELSAVIKAYQGDASIRQKGKEHAIRSGRDNDLVRAFTGAIRDQEGTPGFVVKSGTADMNTLGHQFKDIPIVAYGPGDSSLDHTPIEHLELDEYEKAIKVVKGVLQTLEESS